MQIENAETKILTTLLQDAGRIAIVPSKVSGFNAFCAAVGLYYMLKEKDKNVSLIYQGKIPDGCVDIIKKDEILSNIFQRELVVSIDYSDTPAASARYSTEHDVLFIKVSPVPRNFDRSKVKTELTGFDFDTIITLGIQELEDLGQTYSELSDEFSKAKIINIDNTSTNTNFGSLNIIDPLADNLSLIVFLKAREWGLIPGLKAAKALLTGMVAN